MLAHKLVTPADRSAKSNELDFLRPDGKSQVTIEYEGKRPSRRGHRHLDAASPTVSHGDLRDAIIEKIIKPVVPAELLDTSTKFHINPTGRFVIGGPQGDTGLTGRKIIVDTYGGRAVTAAARSRARIPRRSIARPATWRATSPRTSSRPELADEVEVQLAYAIGVADPVSVYVDTFGTGSIDAGADRRRSSASNFR